MQDQKMIEELKELFQAFIAPALEGIRGDLRALSAEIKGVDTKVDSYRRELLAEIHRVEATLSADFVRLESKVDLRLAAMDEKLDLFRRDCSPKSGPHPNSPFVAVRSGLRPRSSLPLPDGRQPVDDDSHGRRRRCIFGGSID
jgi:hypothetical protein